MSYFDEVDHPTLPSYDTEFLDAHFDTLIESLVIEPGTSCATHWSMPPEMQGKPTLFASPLHNFFRPVAWAWRTEYTDDPTQRCNAQIFAIYIGRNRLRHLVNQVDLVGKARAWLDTDDLVLCKPSAADVNTPPEEQPRRAHPLRLPTFTNAALAEPLYIVLGNPNKVSITTKCRMWGTYLDTLDRPPLR